MELSYPGDITNSFTSNNSKWHSYHCLRTDYQLSTTIMAETSSETQYRQAMRGQKQKIDWIGYKQLGERTFEFWIRIQLVRYVVVG